ncbi:hypothetical protein BEWA_019390 [Theileria equi strain WA]|uniref:Uncharacterized protein n=1 Tax=Theileria equi strain WA TaxID=1537102 RepID=L0AW19_THEEQ|nr:hypothetical protein BEWA_019390 [Theileria equi strain WA]AFZ79094.1 hypothetical protein BEWA_019390 [Theileria equi strain WA]|eukprot:XP_004828760.1 hypothetical protein BEWA_019390 [Theileria equi strain WA]
MLEQTKTPDKWKQSSMLMAGLSLFQSLRVALTAARFAAKRFNIPKANVDIFISRIHTSMEVSCFLGVLLMTLYIILVPRKYSKYNNFISVMTNWLLFFVYSGLLYAYASNRTEGKLTLYYWLLVVSGFSFGLNQAIVVSVGVSYVAFFTAAIPISGIEVSIYHMIFFYIARRIGNVDVNYWIVVIQIMIAMAISGIGAILWSYGFYKRYNGELYERKRSIFRSMKQALSPILMSSLAMGLVFLVFPAISPYKLAEPRIAHRIDLLILFTLAIPTLINCYLCYLNIGPNVQWKVYKGWHFCWIFLIPYIFSITCFFISLHYQDLFISVCIRNNPFVLAVLCFVFAFSHSSLKAVGYTGAGMQELTKNGNVSAMNLLFAHSFLVIFTLLGDGYIKTFKKYERDPENWPTKEFGFWRSLWFWIRRSCSGAFKNFKASFTLDIGTQLRDRVRDIQELQSNQRILTISQR